MSAAATPVYTRTRRRALELQRSESAPSGNAAEGEAACKSEEVRRRKSPRFNPIAAPSEQSVSRPAAPSGGIAPVKAPEEPPASLSVTAKTRTAEPVTPPQQRDPVDVPTQLIPVTQPQQSDPADPPPLTVPQPTITLPLSDAPQHTPKPRRKVNGRPKPMGCDSTGRRRSARLNKIESLFEPNAVPDVVSQPLAVQETRSLPSRSMPSVRSGTSGSKGVSKALIAQKYIHKGPPIRGFSLCLGVKVKTGPAASPCRTGSGSPESYTAATESSPSRQPGSDAAHVQTHSSPVRHLESGATPEQTEPEDTAAQPPSRPSQTMADEAAVLSPPNQGQIEAVNAGPGKGLMDARPAAAQSAPGKGHESEAPPQKTTSGPAAAQSAPAKYQSKAPPQKTTSGPAAVPKCPTERPEASNMDSYQSSTSQGPFQDDGSRKCRLRVSLREIPEARHLSGLELDKPASGVTAGKRKRTKKGKKEKKKGVRNVRGLAKPRDLAEPADRPVLMVVGDKEFWSEPNCTKVVPTIRLLTLANLPGPFRSYNMFPSTTRLEILRQFLQRYSWAEVEDVLRCIGVFENVAAEAYGRVMVDARKLWKEKYGPDKEDWKGYCPRWCKDVEIWKGLCDIWMNPIWEQQSSTNRQNKLKDGHFISHVGGSRSSFRLKKAMAVERGSPVPLKELFDRTHMKDTKDGKVYVNKRARRSMVMYVALQQAHGKEMKEEELWELAVDGEDKKGRLFGFGNKSRTSRANRELEAVEASVSDPTKSTATSAEDSSRKFTQEEVANLVAEKLAAARNAFHCQLTAQEQRHKAELEKVTMDTSFSKACFDTLFNVTGAKPPKMPERSKGMAGGGGFGEGEENQQ